MVSDEKFIEIYNFAKNYFNTGHTWISFYIEENRYCNVTNKNQGGEYYDFGNLWNGKLLSKSILEIEGGDIKNGNSNFTIYNIRH